MLFRVHEQEVSFKLPGSEDDVTRISWPCRLSLVSAPFVRDLSGEKPVCGVFIFRKCLKANGAPIRSCLRLPCQELRPKPVGPIMARRQSRKLIAKVLKTCWVGYNSHLTDGGLSMIPELPDRFVGRLTRCRAGFALRFVSFPNARADRLVGAAEAPVWLL